MIAVVWMKLEMPYMIGACKDVSLYFKFFDTFVLNHSIDFIDRGVSLYDFENTIPF
jgi:hypothetical protein